MNKYDPDEQELCLLKAIQNLELTEERYEKVYVRHGGKSVGNESEARMIDESCGESLIGKCEEYINCCSMTIEEWDSIP